MHEGMVSPPRQREKKGCSHFPVTILGELVLRAAEKRKWTGENLVTLTRKAEGRIGRSCITTEESVASYARVRASIACGCYIAPMIFAIAAFCYPTHSIPLITNNREPSQKIPGLKPDSEVTIEDCSRPASGICSKEPGTGDSTSQEEQ